MKKQSNVFKQKNKTKPQGEKNLSINETETSNLPWKKFKIIVIKVLYEIGRMNEHNENFNKKKI